MTPPHPLTIAILGGGLSGAAVAYHLAQKQLAVRIVVIEPRATLGAGLAYSATDPAHRLNVPDRKMTLRSDVPDDYARWSRGRAAPEDIAPDGDIFTARAGFGAYVADQMAPLLRDGRVRHLRLWARLVERTAGRYDIALSDGTWLRADMLVLALSHPKPHLPREIEMLTADPGLIRDPLAQGALDEIGPGDRLAIIGNGLTALDVVATLGKRGFHGQITSISRHGWRSKPHGPTQPETLADFARDPAPTALALLQRIRRALAVDAALGLTWHAVFDRLRGQGPAIWGALNDTERLRLIRHLRSLWDIHRFRIAPQTALAAADLTARGQLETLAARLISAQGGADLTLTIRPRGQTGLRHLVLDRVVLATGPHHATVLTTTPVLASLAGQGLIAPDRTRLGIATAASGLAICATDRKSCIFVAGPLARGAVGELMGVPEVITWAEHVAVSLAKATGWRCPEPAPDQPSMAVNARRVLASRTDEIASRTSSIVARTAQVASSGQSEQGK